MENAKIEQLKCDILGDYFNIVIPMIFAQIEIVDFMRRKIGQNWRILVSILCLIFLRKIVAPRQRLEQCGK